jgi:hypothetical protein
MKNEGSTTSDNLVNKAVAAGVIPAPEQAPSKKGANKQASKPAAKKEVKPASKKASKATAPKKAAKPANEKESKTAGKPAKKNAKGSASVPREFSKKAIVLDLLRRKDGATMAEIAKATDWQNHSIRGFISGNLTKKMGLVVESAKNEAGERTYRIASK